MTAQYVVATIGACLSIFSAARAALWWFGLKNLVLAPGEVVSIDHRWSGDALFYFLTVKFERKGQWVPFEAAHGYPDQRYSVGDAVFVRIDRKKPEMHDEAFSLSYYSFFFVIGMVLFFSAAPIFRFNPDR